jgi:hypothetical protein
MKVVLRTMVMLLTLSASFVATQLPFRLRTSEALVQKPDRPSRTYSRGLAGSSTVGSFITLNSSDGMSFTKWTLNFDSSARAQREMAKRLKDAVKIISREPLSDGSGERVGETVVALVPPNGADYAAARLMWTNKEEFCQVDGATLNNILEYRKDFNH